MDISQKLLRQKQDFDDVYEAGKKAEYDKFWDSALKNEGGWVGRFYGSCWTDVTFKPNKDLKPRGNANSMFNTSQMTDLSQQLKNCGISLDMSQATSLNQGFAWSTIAKVPFINAQNCTTVQGIFSNCTKLVEVEGLVLNENCKLVSAFDNCTKLEKIIVSGTIGQNGLNVSWSTLLTHDSLMSIINTLKDYSADTSGTQHTVTLGTENLAKLTDSEKATATQKGWTLA